ncbi:uncharacterized protein [Rutidosis leptorrhynchoides]|uniref:uncharacterized protein n=1 Tax=Rutidosis leptorrhynchoides TaxID=125765 RepID=UPI003A9A15E9
MEPPVAAEVETKSEKTGEKERAKSYDCGLCDTEVVYKIAQELLPGLASACVDNTTGGLFTSAGSIAVDMRNEMADYLTQRSETYVAEFLLSENASGLELSEHPYDIIINLIDDFSASKTNMFSRVSEWVLSDRREDRIEDFVQEMEIHGFWLLARRECIATILLKNVDYKNAFHCNMVCSSEEEIVKHRAECKFRSMDCTNEGCTTRYCAAQKEHHEAICPFMVLPCEQKCPDFVLRREMDRHCVTICPMKLVNCAFYTVGCKSSIPRCNVQQHNVDELSSHLLYIIRKAHKEANDDDLKRRVEQLQSLSNIEKLARARDARALTYLIKDAESKLGPLDVKSKPPTDESADSPSHEEINKNELPPTKTEPVEKDGSDVPKKNEELIGSQPNNEIRSSTEKPSITEEDTKLPTKEVGPESPNPVESTITKESYADPPVQIEESKDKGKSSSPAKKEQDVNSGLLKKDDDLRTLQDDNKGLEARDKEQTGSPIKRAIEEKSEREEEEKDMSTNAVSEESIKSLLKESISEALSGDPKESKKSFEEVSKQLSSSDEEETEKSPKKETLKQSLKDDDDEKELSKLTNEEIVKDSLSQMQTPSLSQMQTPRDSLSQMQTPLEPSSLMQTPHDSSSDDDVSMKSPSSR